MLDFDCSKVILEDSIGSTYTLRIRNSSSLFCCMCIKSSHPDVFSVCDQNTLTKCLSSQEGFDVVIKTIGHPMSVYGNYFVTVDTGNNIKTIPLEFQTDYERCKSPELPSSAVIECQICYASFDNGKRVPRIIKECGHTLCQRCCQQLMIPNKNQFIICPVDRTSTAVYGNINNLPKNSALIQLINESRVEKTKSIGPAFCNTHEDQRLFFVCTEADCSSEEKSMCSECMVEDGLHEGHSYTSSKKMF
ncbi:unnamed protein product [Caenorhabditis nigoni]